MKQTLLSISLFGFITIAAFSQTSKKKADPDHTNYYRPVTAALKTGKVDIQDAVSKMDFAKFKLKIVNTTTGYLLYKPQESSFTIAGVNYTPEDKKTILIQPLDNAGRVLDVKGNGANLHVDSYSFTLDGLYKVVPTADPVKAPDFMLPASVNQFTSGDFTIEMVNISKKTQETAVKFKVTYTGNGIGIVEPKNLAVKLESGQTFANDKRDKAIILEKGESDTFNAVFHIEGKIADMQFANMQIVWNDTFKNAELKKTEGASLNIVLDPGMTAGKN